MNWLRKLFGFHIHERKLFLIGNICFVKCVTCGAESIPWTPPLKAIKEARDQHLGDAELYARISK